MNVAPTGIGVVMLVGFLGGALIGLLASILFRACGAPVEVLGSVFSREG